MGAGSIYTMYLAGFSGVFFSYCSLDSKATFYLGLLIVQLIDYRRRVPYIVRIINLQRSTLSTEDLSVGTHPCRVKGV